MTLLAAYLLSLGAFAYIFVNGIGLGCIARFLTWKLDDLRDRS